MRAPLTSILVLAGLLVAERCDSAATPRVIPRVQIAGREYVPLSDWAAAHRFEVRWVKHDETLQLTNRWATLLFLVDSRKANVNGVQVWLCFPLLYKNGAVFLAQLDAESTLQPLLSPPRSSPGSRVRTICLDPGHGGKDSGNRVGLNQEKIYTLLLAEELRRQLLRAGFKVILTRDNDDFVELPERPELAKRRKADLFVSLHFNSAENGRESVRGAEVYCLTPVGADSTNAGNESDLAGWFLGNRCDSKNLVLAYQVQKELTRGLAVEDRGVRRARFWVLCDATMPAVLIEAGFMSHPDEGRKIFTGMYRRQMAHAITQGLLAYKRVVEKPVYRANGASGTGRS